MGKIKRIQMRGISRTPSDRLTADGGCSESLNVYLDTEETAPVLKPEDITASLGIPDVKGVEKVFIHKTNSAENYILFVRDDDHYLSVRHYVDGKLNEIVLLEREGEIKDVTSVGNTLVIVGSLSIHYALYGGGQYKYLGTKIPEPYIEFRSVANNRYADASIIPMLSNSDGTTVNSVDLFNLNAWEKGIDGIKRDTEENTGSKERLQELQEEVWGVINRRIKSNWAAKVFTRPVFVRYAVRLFDGSYIYQSIPILLGAGSDKFVELTGTKIVDSSGKISTYLTVTPLLTYEATANLVKWDKEGWEDIIESVDIFVTTDVSYPFASANFAKIELVNDGSDVIDIDHYAISFDNGDVPELDAIEKELLSKSLFYKIASYKTADLKGLQEGVNIMDTNYPSSQDALSELDRLPDYELSGFEIIPSSVFSYNNRVIANGAKRVLPSGYAFLQSTNIVRHGKNSTERSFAYFIPGSDSVMHKVISKSPDNESTLTPYGMKTSDEGGASYSYAESYGLLFHPDARCESVQLWHPSGDVLVVAMRPHPLLNCSYAFWGLSKTLDEYDGQPTSDVTLADFLKDEKKYEDDSHKVYQSEVNNPFYYPVSGVNTFSSKVLGLATATAPLSQGQFGQFPLYVFTEDGIWAMETAADGSFVTSKPLSREVCSNTASITPIDQAVIFMSDKGLMLLQGSQITELSPYMNGKHYMINPTARAIIDGLPEFCSLLDAVEDNTPFMAFMKDAEIGYDYQGKRLVCFNKNKAYQYVYKLDTQTWHKTFHTDAVSEAVPLNSYPRCEVMVKSVTGSTRIIDFSTSLDGSKEELPERGVIVTRPFDMDEPDVLKTITDVRVRGQFAKGAVKFILQGSQDGINFYTISTLRGKAWKMFRLILLTDLDVHDRLSWVDVMFDSRFTNKLR